MLKVVQEENESNESAGGSLLDEIVREGARAMLAAALQAEVAAYVETFAGEVDHDGRRLVVRNGHHERREVRGCQMVCVSGRSRGRDHHECCDQ